MHDRVATPLMITVHAPHWPSPQPNRGPCSPRSLRRTYKRGVEGSISNVCAPPLTFRVTLLMALLRRDSDDFTRTPRYAYELPLCCIMAQAFSLRRASARS